MRLVVVGCAGSFPSPESAASSYLVQADDADGRTWNLLLDLGNGALGPLQTHLDPSCLDAIAISHTHADHVADIPVLGVMLRYAPTGCPRTEPMPSTMVQKITGLIIILIRSTNIVPSTPSDLPASGASQPTSTPATTATTTPT